MWIIWPFRKKNFGSAWTICADFRRFIEDDIGRFLIQDESRLPHPKQSIFESICIILITETNEAILDAARQCAFEIAFFQKEVGALPLHPLGSSDGYAQVRAANPAGKATYDRFKLKRDADWERIKAVLSKLKTRR